MNSILLVAAREISTRLRSKAYVITTMLLLILIVAFTVVMKLISGSGGADATVGVTAQNGGLAAPMRAAATTVGQTVQTPTVASEAAGRERVESGELDALLVGDGSRVEVVVDQDLDRDLRTALNVLASQLALNQEITGLGGDPARVNAAVAEAAVQVRPINAPNDYGPEQLVIGIIVGGLIYMSVLINGQLVAQGVVEEKTSRVVELLLSTIRPWQLMAGKVLGIGTIGLLQMAAIAIVGVVSGLSTGTLTLSISAAAGTVTWLIVWYLLGFFCYAMVFAALGALVSRQEDVGGAVTPPLMLIIAGWVVGISVLPSDPGNSLAETMSIIPAFAPTLMPMRLAMGGVPVWQAALALALVAAMIPALIWLAGRIYRNAVMRTGAKVKFRDALRTT
ncbi:ABC transporter permease [Amycolatopsis cihanbeyliensis]|uniref:ABC-2 type transport system permease protein n=1 Tax=Amycolatopsis cihanbeyliensis TaxID=1128664 RepID=A0A542DMN7_AMYCI|nr:ABC transporter permease [Amycolatopsis cihanbeyliensis]TQJ04353.1 ABC-2 type transport system permease protein [Amycolatopsis cihanbeyliensis]